MANAKAASTTAAATAARTRRATRFRRERTAVRLSAVPPRTGGGSRRIGGPRSTAVEITAVRGAEHSGVLGLWTLPARGDLELHPLVLGEGGGTAGRHRGIVDEDIVA